MTLADLHLQLGLGCDVVVAGGLHNADMEECVARPIPQLDEAEAFFGVEPLDGCVNYFARRIHATGARWRPVGRLAWAPVAGIRV